MELSELLRTSAGRVPSKPALIVASDDRVVTYAELDAEVDRVAAGLQDLGVSAGDRVALALPNSVAFVVAYLGILRSGGVVVPLNIALTEPEVRSILEDATPQVIVTDAERAPAMKAAAGTPPLVEHVVVADSWSDLAPEGATPRAAAVGEDDLAVLAYTSGTTGAPKGAMLTHGNLLSNLRQQMAIPEDTVREDDVMLLTLPMFHIFGLNVPLGLLVMNGATGVIVDRFEPVEALRLIGRHRVSVMFGAPPMFGALVNTPGADAYDISSVRLAISGAAPLSEEVLKAFRDIFGSISTRATA